MYVYALSFVDFESDSVCGGPLFAPQSTSVRVQDRFEFVELGRGMSFNHHRRHWDYRLVLLTIDYTRAQYMCKHMWYVQVPEVHLWNTYEYLNTYVPFVTYVWRAWETICIYLVLMIFHDCLHLLFTVYAILTLIIDVFILLLISPHPP